MSELEIYFNEYCKTAAWARRAAEECGCRGRGWWLSEVDTWHQCPVHGAGKPHPEDDSGEDYEPPAGADLFAPERSIEEGWDYEPPPMADDDAPF